MGAAETARLLASLDLKDNFSPGANKAIASLGRLESTGFRVGQNIGKGINNAAHNIAKIGAIAGGAALAGLTASVQAASNLEQAVGAVDSVYGKSARTIEAWGKQAAEAAGLSKREVNEMAAVTGAQLQGMGFQTEEAAKQAVILQKRAADLAATFGGPTADAMQAISSLLRGERDPIERYGVSIKAVDVAARIAAKGLDTSTAAAKKQAEAIAGLELLLEQTAKSQGAFAREQDTLAGSQARLRANLENTGATIGRVLLPQLSKLAGRFNELLVANEPAITRFAEQLPPLFDKVLATVERIPWESIGASLQIAGTGAKALLDAFLAMPPWVQTAVITGWGLNKLTGGALGGIVSELAKGLIKGVLGINAGVVNVNAASINGAGGVPVPGGAGRAAQLLSVVQKVFIVGMVAEVASLIHGPLDDLAKDIHKNLIGDKNPLSDFGRAWNDWRKNADWPFGQKNAPEWARLGPGSPDDVVKEISKAGDRNFDRFERLFKPALSADLRNFDRLDRSITTGLTALQSQSHKDLQEAIASLDNINTPIAQALEAVIAGIRSGSGGDTETAALVKDLEARRTAALAKGDKATADALADAIKKIEPFAKGRQWQQEQLAKADKIATSNAVTAEKVAALKGIQSDLLDHQRTMAAGIVGALLNDVVGAINRIRVPSGQTPRVNSQTGFVTGGTPIPKPSTSTPDIRQGFVIKNTVTVSSADVTDAQNTRARWGPTATEAGAA